MISGSATPRRILLIDEDPDDAPHLAETLRTTGVEVIVAPGGEEALARAWQVAPDLIVLDVQIPGDYRLLDIPRIRRHEGLCKTPVVVFGPGAHRLPVFSALIGTVLLQDGRPGSVVTLDRLAAPEMIRSTVSLLLE